MFEICCLRSHTFALAAIVLVTGAVSKGIAKTHPALSFPCNVVDLAGVLLEALLIGLAVAAFARETSGHASAVFAVFPFAALLFGGALDVPALVNIKITDLVTHAVGFLLAWPLPVPGVDWIALSGDAHFLVSTLTVV